ncbi:MAG: hypothetical protein ACTHNN_08770 [Xanthobacteraceae bacterium]
MTIGGVQEHDLSVAMAGHSRSKNGVASLAYVPAIHVFPFLTSQIVDARDKPGHDGKTDADGSPLETAMRRPTSLPRLEAKFSARVPSHRPAGDDALIARR